MRALLSPTYSCRIPEDSCPVPGLNIGWCTSQFFQSCGGTFLRTWVSPEDFRTGLVLGLKHVNESHDIWTCAWNCHVTWCIHMMFVYHPWHVTLLFHHHHHHLTWCRQQQRRPQWHRQQRPRWWYPRPRRQYPRPRRCPRRGRCHPTHCANTKRLTWHVESWGILGNPQESCESCRNQWGTEKYCLMV